MSKASHCSHVAAIGRQMRRREERLSEEDFAGGLGIKPRHTSEEEKEENFLSSVQCSVGPGGERTWVFER